jgi:hypothetical protein
MSNGESLTGSAGEVPLNILRASEDFRLQDAAQYCPVEFSIATPEQEAETNEQPTE